MGANRMFVRDDDILSDAETIAARWVKRRIGTWTHERRVLSIATQLFQLTKSHLRIGRSERRLLRLAAIVHDVGRSISEKRHPTEGAELIVNATALLLSPGDRRAVAFLTRYHRGAVPPIANEEYLNASDHRRSLRIVLSLLRVSDALDSRQIESPELELRFDRSHLDVRCVVRGNVAEARRVYQRRKKFRMLEQYLRHPITVHVARKHTPTPAGA